jgi:hypothetical protein
VGVAVVEGNIEAVRAAIEAAVPVDPAEAEAAAAAAQERARAERGAAAASSRATQGAGGDGPPPDPEGLPEQIGASSGAGGGTVRRIGDRDTLGLPKGCPLTPIGKRDRVFYYLDADGQFLTLTDKDHGKLPLTGIFGNEVDLLEEFWPRYNKQGDVAGWDANKAAQQLMAACARKGIFNPFGKVRGVGAWLGGPQVGDEMLVWHCGDVILMRPREPERIFPGGPPSPFNKGEEPAPEGWVALPPGQIGPHLYPADQPRPRPWETFVAAEGTDAKLGPGPDLLTTLCTWNWKRGKLDARLLLGWIGAGMLGGALAWRPMIWITGDKATGKSTLQKLLRFLYGDAILSLTNATGAGVWQELGFSSLPVAVDELEAEQDNRQAKAVTDLARQASSGGVIARGGADHKGVTFKAQACFAFSSILIPPMPGQDRRRMTILELDPLASTQMPKIAEKEMNELGRKLRRRLFDRWPDLFPTIEAFRDGLINAGLKGSFGDQTGVLLAIGELLLHDGPVVQDMIDGIAQEIAAEHKRDGMSEDELGDADRCLSHLLTSAVDVFRNGARKTVAQWVGEACDNQVKVGVLDERAEAQTVLQGYGMRVIDLAPKLEDGSTGVRGRWLAVANSHQGLAQVFQNTHWAGRSGTLGVWSQTLRRVTGALTHSGLRFSGHQSRAVLVPIDAVLLSEDLTSGGVYDTALP